MKEEQYRNLIEKRKAFAFRDGLTNPSSTCFDIDEIEPWAQWQNNLNCRIMVVGQEFCDLDTYCRCTGKVETKERSGYDFEFPSNRNLRRLLASIGFDPGHPNSPNKEAYLFFTNAVFGLKPGNMSANFKNKWLKQSREEFLEPLIQILDPEMIISLGGKATQSVAQIFKFKFVSMSYHVENPRVKDKPKIFPVFHPGGLGIRNRSWHLQLEDWKKIKDWM